VATADYFRAMRIPLRSGRLFDDTHQTSTPQVALIKRHDGPAILADGERAWATHYRQLARSLADDGMRENLSAQIVGGVMIGTGMQFVFGGDPQRAYAVGGWLKPVHAALMHGILVLPLRAWQI
jgi:hypothetical protein